MEHLVATVACPDCTDIATRLVDTFSTASGILDSDLLEEAQHGLGHGIRRVSTLPAAIQICEDSDFAEPCLGGVFMQHFYDKSFAQPNESLWVPGACDRISETQRTQCASSVGEALMFAMWHDVERAQEAC
eukprot:480781_1